MSGVRIDCIADTSAIIGLSRRDQKTIAAVQGREFGIAFITVAELAVGILAANNRSAAAKRLEAVLGNRRGWTLYPSDLTPLVYAEICHDLERKGARIPSNDIWIAAVAIENDLPLVGRDEHFTRVAGLKFVPC